MEIDNEQVERSSNSIVRNHTPEHSHLAICDSRVDTPMDICQPIVAVEQKNHMEVDTLLDIRGQPVVDKKNRMEVDTLLDIRGQPVVVVERKKKDHEKKPIKAVACHVAAPRSLKVTINGDLPASLGREIDAIQEEKEEKANDVGMNLEEGFPPASSEVIDVIREDLPGTFIIICQLCSFSSY